MKGTTRCSDHGQNELVTADGKPYWQPSLRDSLSWCSPERVVERRIIKAFVRSGGERIVQVTVPGNICLSPGLIASVKRLVADSMYRIDISVSGSMLTVTAV